MATVLIVIYEVLIYQIPFFGSLEFEMTDPRMSAAVGMNALVTGMLEELPFRAVILYAFLRLWGNSKGNCQMAKACGGYDVFHFFGRQTGLRC